VANPVNAIERRDADGFLEIPQFAGSATNIQAAIFAHHGDTGRIVAAIFEAFQAVEN
jgi:hypothetical protein